ncbi:MAG: T9SS type A sorting domain-containing protein [Dysgonomonas sp.]
MFNGQNKTGNVINSEFPVLLNLLPSTPNVRILDIRMEDGAVYFGLSAESARAEQFGITVRRKVGNRFYTLSHILSVDEAKNFHSASKLSDGVFVVSHAQNKFGYASSEELNLSDYITSIEDNDAAKSVSLYPNPVKDIINLQGDINTIKSVECLNLKGQTLMQIGKLESKQIDVSNLPSGIYIFEIQYIEQGKKDSFKIIKY